MGDKEETRVEANPFKLKNGFEVSGKIIKRFGPWVWVTICTDDACVFVNINPDSPLRTAKTEQLSLRVLIEPTLTNMDRVGAAVSNMLHQLAELTGQEVK